MAKIYLFFLSAYATSLFGLLVIDGAICTALHTYTWRLDACFFCSIKLENRRCILFRFLLSC